MNMESETDQILNQVLISVSVQGAIEAIGRHYGIDFVTFHMVSNVKKKLDNPFVRTTYANRMGVALLAQQLCCDRPHLAKSGHIRRAILLEHFTTNPCKPAHLD